MMLHEAVMLEIYRQALNASELVSPRCQSRESTASVAPGEARCPSNDSHCSGNDSATPAHTPAPTTPPVGLPLPATLAPAAAAALLPTQSAAMAAYLNAAAAAAQQNHLLLTNPLAAAASLVQHATQSHSPTASRMTSSSSPSGAADASSVLDFSTKHLRRESERSGSDEDDAEEKQINDNENGGGDEGAAEDANSPLDLSVGSMRKRQNSIEEPLQPPQKNARINDFKSIQPGTWVPPINPYLAAVAAASLSPKTPVQLDWSSKQKISPNEATKALEKMTEMTRLGSTTETETPMRQATANAAANNNNNNSNNSTSSGRHSAWQSHWLNKGADAVKDVFKCVWCKQSFSTLASLTTHMKETQHCGVNVPPSVSATANAVLNNSSNGNQTSQMSSHNRYAASQNNTSGASSGGGNGSGTSNKSDLNLLIKETMPLPRKLVRGQDVWLGKGAEQTRQILKCMWCGQSFRSLAEMTTHMQETQHYTNIISQEQIISWKSSDDKSSSSGSSNGAATSPAVTSPSSTTSAAPPSNTNTSSTNSTVSAVLTCKVCDQAFLSLKELSNHMVKNSHFKDQVGRPPNEVNVASVARRGRQTREKRKKSLPVRKLLELERAKQDYKNGGTNSLDSALKPLRDFAATTKITCEKCGDKIETVLFVDHIRQCLGGMIPEPTRKLPKVPPYAMTLDRSDRINRSQTPSDGRKTADDSSSVCSPPKPDIICPMGKEGEKPSSTPSVLNAIEQLIEKSFDTRSRHGGNANTFGSGGSHGNTPLGSNILKRLGIDDSSDYTKPLMDPQTMHFLRSYSSFSGRDRSASESSSFSERCSSRFESVTPERNSELSRQTTPRLTPEKAVPLVSESSQLFRGECLETVKIKSEPTESTEIETTDIEALKDIPQKISVKKEFTMTDNDEVKTIGVAVTANEHERSSTPSSRAVSPNTSERSITPRDSPSDKKISTAGSSLNALSSMFDNLNNMNNTTLTGSVSVASADSSTGGGGGGASGNQTKSTSKKSNASPLAALRKLCENTDAPAPATRNVASSATNYGNTSVTPTSSINGGNNSASSATGNMIAFSWACNDAIMSADLVIKCSFCDTPFCSKGAYRHHLSKVHFVKEEAAEAQVANALKSPSGLIATSPKSIASPKSNSSRSPAQQQQIASPTTHSNNSSVNMSLPPTINPYDDSAQSKFLKYTELAKQLSSKKG